MVMSVVFGYNDLLSCNIYNSNLLISFALNNSLTDNASDIKVKRKSSFCFVFLGQGCL